ncbi:M48 family metallopeptidase [Allorhizocola rhizosphaerae]|uniref:M48 family metallopeptidase n=1 Tax=Allorhizocola rhizosphaerae TaxID=1872709 RepID=UPI001FE7506A|nr:M48 family metallopeptidase [Allorhizocola rhizosphaerae]
MRAFLSVIMLFGFFVVGLLQLAGAAALAFWLGTMMPAGIAIKLTLPLFIALVGGAGVAMWKAMRAKDEPMPGVTLTANQAPRLWAEVQGLAKAVGARAPDEIRIVGDVNAAVSENAKLMGLIPGRRMLYIGLPLLQALSMSQTRAVLAHEMGHYSGAHTRLGGVAYRGRLAIVGTLGRIGKWNPTGWIFNLYARLYLLVDNAVSRRQELQADAAAVRVAGKQAAVGALTEVSVAAMAYDFYIGRYVAPGAEFGYLPDNVFGRFGALVAARQDELVRLRAEVPAQQKGGVWDTHPPLGVRIAAIQALPESNVGNDPRPATELLPDIEMIGRMLHQMVVQTDGRTVLPWDDFTAATLTARLQAQADSIFRELSRRLGQPNMGLPQVIAALDAGRAGEMGEPFFPNATRREAAARFAEPLTVLLDLAAVRSGRAFWKTSMAANTMLVGPDGGELDLSEIASLAVVRDTLPQALAKLAGMGILIESAAVVEQTATARGADVIAGMANLKVGGQDTDVLVLDNGLIMVGASGDKDHGRERLIQIINSAPVHELARMHRFLPFEEIRAVNVVKTIPLRAELELHNGQKFELRESWTGEELHKKSREMMLDIFKRINDV